MNTLYTIENQKGETLLTIISDLIGNKIVYGYFIKNTKVITICPLTKLNDIINKAQENYLIVYDWQF